jgi:hypothetical protein
MEPLNNVEEQENQHDHKDQADAASPVVPHARAHAITAEAEAEYQNDEKNDQQHSLSFVPVIYAAFLLSRGANLGFEFDSVKSQ